MVASLALVAYVLRLQRKLAHVRNEWFQAAEHRRTYSDALLAVKFGVGDPKDVAGKALVSVMKSPDRKARFADYF